MSHRLRECPICEIVIRSRRGRTLNLSKDEYVQAGAASGFALALHRGDPIRAALCSPCSSAVETVLVLLKGPEDPS
jgi:hypothetical protein